MTSVLNVDTIAAKDGTSPVGLTKQAAAKVFADFNTSSNNTIEKSLNVASKTDNGVGDSTLNFSNSFDGTAYGAHFDHATNAVGNSNIYVGGVRNSGKSAGSCRVLNAYDPGTITGSDSDNNSFLAVGDLA